MYLSMKDAANKLGVSQTTIRRLAKKGEIKKVMLSSNHAIYDVDEYLERLEKEQSVKKS